MCLISTQHPNPNACNVSHFCISPFFKPCASQTEMWYKRSDLRCIVFLKPNVRGRKHQESSPVPVSSMFQVEMSGYLCEHCWRASPLHHLSLLGFSPLLLWKPMISSKVRASYYRVPTGHIFCLSPTSFPSHSSAPGLPLPTIHPRALTSFIAEAITSTSSQISPYLGPYFFLLLNALPPRTPSCSQLPELKFPSPSPPNLLYLTVPLYLPVS